MITVNELFSGIGTQSLAFKYLGIPHKVVGMAEISKPAITAYETLHGPTRNYGDISEAEKLDYADLWTYSFPCQDLSAGGKGAGLEKGTRSGLLWEVERLLEKSVQEGEAPKFLLLENVPDLVRNSKHKKGLDKWLDKLVELGYDNYYCVLNAADYGVPQNRERLFVVSTRKDLEREVYFFNIEKQPLAGFKNFVEDWVNEYKGPLMIDSTISPYLIDNFTRDIEKISRATDTPIWTCECKSGFQDNRVGIWYSPTIRHQNTHTAIFHNNQIHKLTSKEAWRFMGIKDEDYQKVEDVGIGKTVIYGLAGNAIVVNVLMEIYKILFIKGVDY